MKYPSPLLSTLIPVAALALSCGGVRGEDAKNTKITERPQAWFDASAALAKKGHLIAVVQVQRGELPLLQFRYDHFPGLERVVETDGVSFARLAGKQWVMSPDWGKTGMAAEKGQVAGIDGVVKLARWAFQPVARDAKEGRVVWRRVEDSGGPTFERSREEPRAGEDYPSFVFINYFKEHDAGPRLHAMRMQQDWEGQPARVTVYYFYQPGETVPPAGGEPGDRILEAARATAAGPMKVDAMIRGAYGCRVAGIISGKDFDLTVTPTGLPVGNFSSGLTFVGAGPVSRQIAVGDDYWVSWDGGATWKKEQMDRTSFDTALAAINESSSAGGLGHWPYEVADAGSASAPARYVVKTPFNMGYDFASYWVVMKDGKGAAVRRYSAGFGNDRGGKYGRLYVEYGDVADAKGVLPPPGNPGAVPGQRPEQMLADAAVAMQQDVWHVDLRMEQQKEVKGGWSALEPAGQVTGLISGKDFDLTRQTPEGDSERRVALKDKVWASRDGGATWSEETTRDFARISYAFVHNPFEHPLATMPYEAEGTEQHDGETWLHIRMVEGQGSFPGSGPEFWLLLDAEGRAVSVRRCAWKTTPQVSDFSGNTFRNYNVEEIKPAADGEKIGDRALK